MNTSINLESVLENLRNLVDRYENVPLIETKELSEILRGLGVNLSHLVELRKLYYNKFQVVFQSSKGTSVAARTKDAEREVPELDLIRKVLRHYEELRKDLRSQISLWKND